MSGNTTTPATLSSKVRAYKLCRKRTQRCQYIFLNKKKVMYAITKKISVKQMTFLTHFPSNKCKNTVRTPFTSFIHYEKKSTKLV